MLILGLFRFEGVKLNFMILCYFSEDWYLWGFFVFRDSCYYKNKGCLFYVSDEEREVFVNECIYELL